MSETRQEDKKHRRPLLILGGLVLLLVGVLAWVILFHDGPPPDDGHLMPTWSEREGNANPLATFCKSLLGSSITDWEKIPYDLRDLDAKASPEAQAFVASHTPEIAAFESLMLTDPGSWQWPDVADMSRYEAYTGRGASECRMLSFMLRSKAFQLYEDGKVEEAMALCLKMAHWSEGLYGAEGFTIHLLVAHNIQYGALHTVQKVLQADEVTPAMLRDVLVQLRTLKGPQTEQYQKAIRVDYAWFKDGVRKFSNREIMGIGQLPSSCEFLAPRFFKRNQTLAYRVRLDTPVMTALGLGWKFALPAIEARTAKVESMHDPYSLLFFMNPNFSGQSSILHTLALPTMRPQLNHREELMLQLALRLHELEHARLPATLDALVPAYLPTVPVDVISGTPFLWNAKLQVLYTVGKNGMDDGGSINDERPERGLDWGVKYLWSPASSSKPAAP